MSMRLLLNPNDLVLQGGWRMKPKKKKNEALLSYKGLLAPTIYILMNAMPQAKVLQPCTNLSVGMAVGADSRR